MVKAIIFDCFGVLTTDFWKEFVATLQPEQIEPARALNYQYASGQLNESDFLKAIKQLTGHLPRVVQELRHNETVKNDELLAYIKQLKPSYKIGMLSNVGSDWIRRSFLSSDEQNLFDDMVFSYEVGLAKPDPEIFELAATGLGEALADCVLVDDSEGHCRAAATLGMKTVIYKDLQQMQRALQPLLA